MRHRVMRKPRMLSLCLAACSVCVAQFELPAQVPAPIPSFEVSTVKPSSPDANHSDLNLNGGAYPFSTQNVNLDQVIKFAYNLNSGSDDQIVGAPSWVHTARFDITTKVDERTIAQLSKMSQEDRIATLRLMIQTLLEDRFHFKIHHETRSLPVIVLTVANPSAKTDPKLHPALDRSTSNEWTGLHNDGQGHIEVRSEPLTVFAQFLGNLPEIGGRMVIDQTHLTGNYDFTLNYTPQQLAESDAHNGSSDPSHASLFAALTEQLGLKLKSNRVPIDVVVIDHIDPPTAN